MVQLGCEIVLKFDYDTIITSHDRFIKLCTKFFEINLNEKCAKSSHVASM